MSIILANPPRPFAAGIIFLPIVQMQKQRPREVELFVQGHTAGVWQRPAVLGLHLLSREKGRLASTACAWGLGRAFQLLLRALGRVSEQGGWAGLLTSGSDAQNDRRTG